MKQQWQSYSYQTNEGKKKSSRYQSSANKPEAVFLKSSSSWNKLKLKKGKFQGQYNINDQ